MRSSVIELDHAKTCRSTLFNCTNRQQLATDFAGSPRTVSATLHSTDSSYHSEKVEKCHSSWNQKNAVRKESRCVMQESHGSCSKKHSRTWCFYKADNLQLLVDDTCYITLLSTCQQNYSAKARHHIMIWMQRVFFACCSCISMKTSYIFLCHISHRSTALQTNIGMITMKFWRSHGQPLQKPREMQQMLKIFVCQSLIFYKHSVCI